MTNEEKGYAKARNCHVVVSKVRGIEKMSLPVYLLKSHDEFNLGWFRINADVNRQDPLPPYRTQLLVKFTKEGLMIQSGVELQPGDCIFLANKNDNF